MNIFVLNECPILSAQEQCDKHVVKMPTESAQMLSTAHRMLDGVRVEGRSKTGRKVTRYVLEHGDDLYYKAVHMNHPCTVWTMESEENYLWHYEHFKALCKEYTHRYGRIHATETKLMEILKTPPKNIPKKSLTNFKLAMKSNPECMFPSNPIKSYRMFYQTKQSRFTMKWTNREIPTWFNKGAA